MTGPDIFTTVPLGNEAGTNPSSIVLYSALYGAREPFNPRVFGDTRTYRRVVFTDQPGLKAEGIEVIHAPQPSLDPVRASRAPKLMPTRFLGEHEWSVYVDNKSCLIADPAWIVQTLRESSSADFFAFPHFARKCLFDEAKVAIEMGLDRADLVRAQIAAYHKAGMPRNFGMIEGHFIVRRATPANERFGEAWFAEIMQWSRRDQISFPFIAWRDGFSYHSISEIPRQKVTIFTVFDRAGRKSDFKGRSRMYLAARRLYHMVVRR